jgi:hypothetical protein
MRRTKLPGQSGILPPSSAQYGSSRTRSFRQTRAWCHLRDGPIAFKPEYRVIVA